MSHFDTIIKQTLKHEGGFVNDPDDPGGATNYGISIRFLKQSPKYDTDGVLVGDLDHDGDIDITDIHLMNKEEAIKIYKEYFWTKYDYERIESYDIAYQVFDMTVNAGARTAQRLVQQALHACGQPVAIDGYAGDETFTALTRVNSSVFVAAYRSERAGYYREISTANSSLKKFLKGWLRRAYDTNYNYSS